MLKIEIDRTDYCPNGKLVKLPKLKKEVEDLLTTVSATIAPKFTIKNTISSQNPHLKPKCCATTE